MHRIARGVFAALAFSAFSFAAMACGGTPDAPPPNTTASNNGNRAPAAPVETVLLTSDGSLTPGDLRGGHSLVDRYDVPVAVGDRVRVSLRSSAFDPVLQVTPPQTAPLSNDDVAGDRSRSELELVATTAGTLKVEVGSFDVTALGSYHVEVRRLAAATAPAVPTLASAVRRHHVAGNTFVAAMAQRAGSEGAPAALRVGDRVRGALAEGDPTLESGEFSDVYTLEIAQPTDLLVQLQSTAFDSFLLVQGPSGQRWENDDAGGTRDASVSIPTAAAGSYRVIATSYRSGETGDYELKALTSRAGSPPVAAAPTAVPAAPATGEHIERGELAAGDTQLSSGEYSDAHELTWPVGTSVHLEARSTAFDTYLIVRAPSGEQHDNDDVAPGITNAGLEFVVREAGAYRVLVTSYRSGETGAYELVSRAGTAPATGAQAAVPPTPPSSAGATTVAQTRTFPGSLASGDTQLSSGEFVDNYTLRFTPGQRVSVRLESSAFDPYLILHTPSGRQEDNDDAQPGSLNSGLDILAAEPGDYRIGVTSYRSGETGAYRLTVTPGGGAAVATAPSTGGTPVPAAPGSPSVWVLSVGISDYPGSGNDLPECANDAVKIAEALRNQGLTSADHQFLLTDAQATGAGVREALGRVRSGIRPEDTFVFFYSGHGGQQQGQSQDQRELDGIDEYIFLHDGPFLDDELGRLVDGIHSRTTIAALDACFAGGFSKDLVTRPGIVGLFSSEEDVTSAVAGQFQAGGYLSHFMRLGIQGDADADPRDRVMTVGELTHFVWHQYAQQAADVRMSMGYQHLVVDRGAVHANQELWRHL